MASRPSVSIVVPFFGNGNDADRLLRSLARVSVLPGDQLIVADNTSDGAAIRAAGADRPVRVVRATAEHSSYHARNVGAAAAANEWLLFLDSDCEPQPRIVEAYFAAPPAERCGAVAGDVVGDPRQAAFLARYARSRRLLSQTAGLHEPERGSAVTANLLVRRRAFDAVGGFTEGIRSGGDFDLARRLLAAGWTIESRPAAVVTHRHREGWVDFMSTIARYAAGARWLDERYPGSARRWPLLPGLAGSARDVLVNSARGRFQEATYRTVDAIGLVAHNLGYFTSNRAGGA